MKRILSLLLVLLVLMGVTLSGTFASFSDTETSAGNVLCAWVEEPCEHDCAAYVTSFTQGQTKGGGDVDGDRSHPEKALGAPDGGCSPIGGFVSLGFGGEIVLEFCHFVGGSLTITEITCANPNYPLEKVEVWGSNDGSNWVFLGYADNTDNLGGSDRHETVITLDENCCIRYVKLIDVTPSGPHLSSADAFDLDAVCGEPCEVFDGTLVIVSDTDTMVTEADGAAVDPAENAVLAWVHPNWGNITGHTFTAEAEWIWETYDTDDPGSEWPEDGRVVRFEREFCIPCNPESATLHITVDNGYNAYINGHLIGCAQVNSCAVCQTVPCGGTCEPCEGCVGCPGWQATDLTEPHVTGSNWTTVEQYFIDIAWLDVGTNTLEILAANEQMDGGEYDGNPAGLIYELVIDYGDDCDYCCTDQEME